MGGRAAAAELDDEAAALDRDLNSQVVLGGEALGDSHHREGWVLVLGQDTGHADSIDAAGGANEQVAGCAQGRDGVGCGGPIDDA